MHIGCNVITHNNIDYINIKDISKRLKNVVKISRSYGLKKVIFSSILVKKQLKLMQVIRQGNFFVNNDSVNREYLVRDGLHLSNVDPHIFSGNLVDFFKKNFFPWEIYLTKNIIDNKKDRFNINENKSNNNDNKSDNDSINNPPNLKRAKEIFVQT